MRIEPDVDSLMWTVAEGSNPHAVDDFEARFPDLKAELSKRVKLLSGLRSAKSLYVPAVRPAFTPHLLASRRQRFTKPALVGAMLLLGAVLAVATFSVASFIGTREAEKAYKQESIDMHNGACIPATPGKFNPSTARSYQARPATSTTGAPSVPDVPQSQGQNAPASESSANTSQAAQGALSAPNDDLSPVQVKLLQVPLSQALQFVGSKAGLQVELAPGMPNPTVDVDYSNMSAASILRAMGAKYGFRALNQGQGKVLAVPIH